ncbi:MAG: aspartate-semialdehyde dehydrogenase [Bdellovibrionales bacterium]
MKKSRMNSVDRTLNVGVVGATGMVGEEFLRLMEQRKFPVKELKLFASEQSRGQRRKALGRDWDVQPLTKDCFAGLDLVFFSSGDDISKEWAPQAVAAGAFAIDNSAAFRMDEHSPLIVPEVNAHVLPPRELPTIIANPNCSTIQLVLALKPLSDHFGLNQVRVATYQAVSGAGRAAMQEMINQTEQGLKNLGPNFALSTSDLPKAQNLPHPIAFNCIPQVGGFGDDGFCSEERKIRLESRKILDLPHLRISAWTVRIPALNVHSEAAWITLDKVVTRAELLKALTSQAGLVVEEKMNDPYPLALNVSGLDPVYVGRIHQDPDDPRTWMMWIVGDNLRKGAALNGIQIAERLFN